MGFDSYGASQNEGDGNKVDWDELNQRVFDNDNARMNQFEKDFHKKNE